MKDFSSKDPFGAGMRGTSNGRPEAPRLAILAGRTAAAVVLLVLALVTKPAISQVQIIGIEENECGISPNYYQTKPVLVACMAESPPFLVKRRTYTPGGEVGCAEITGKPSSSKEVEGVVAVEYAKAAEEMSGSSAYEMSSTLFHSLYTGYDADMLLAIMSSGVFRKHDYEVKLYKSSSAALYGLREKECDFSLSGMVHVGSVISDEHCDAGTLKDGTAFLEYEGTCPRPREGVTPTLDNVCCLEYTRWYKRWGPAVLTLQLPKESQSTLFFENITAPEVLRIICAVILALLLSGHLIWLFERRDNSIQFPEDYGVGVDHGLWWSVVTMTTVGYGDKAPVTFLGRFLGVIWMFVGVILLGYLNGLMVEGYIDPPARYFPIETWMDIRDHHQSMGVQFCAASDTFFNSTLAHESLVPSDIRNNTLDAMVFEDTLEECYGLLMEGTVAGVIDNKPRLMYDSMTSASNQLGPLSTCHDLTVSPVIEPVYHSAVVRRPSTDPDDFSKNLKCSLDTAIQEFQDGQALFSRPDHATGPSYTSRDAHMAWFREYLAEETNLLSARDENTSDQLFAYMLLCATLLAYCVMFVALWIARYRKANYRRDMAGTEGEELVPKSRMPHYDSQLGEVDDYVSKVEQELGDAASPGDMREPDAKSMALAARLNEDRLITVCEQLSDLRLMIKRLENQQAGIQMPKARQHPSKTPKTPKARGITDSVSNAVRGVGGDQFSSPFSPDNDV